MLQVSEIYKAICGESRHNGRPCSLVRLTGCHLRCAWCDTAHAFEGGRRMTVGDVVEVVRENGLETVLVTGGEPLLQSDVVELMRTLMLDEGRWVLLETSGTVLPERAVKLTDVPHGVHRVVDIKAPSSGIKPEQIDWDGIGDLQAPDEVKVVCADREDYEWARGLVSYNDPVPIGVPISLSPVHGQLNPRDLAAWILEDNLEVFLQVQLHKLIWPEVDRGV